MKFSLLLIFTFSASLASAQTMIVRQVKGDKAVVQLTDGSISVGETIHANSTNNVGDDPSFNSPSSADVSRHNVIGISTGVLSSLKSTDNSGGGNTSSSNVFDLEGRYGWNKETTEYGFLGALKLVNTGGGNDPTYGIGGFFDFNFAPNRPGTKLIFGAGIQAEFEQENPPAGVAGRSYILGYPMLFMKWFCLGTSTALRTDLGYSYEQVTQSSVKTTTSGLYGDIGFGVYF